MKLGDWLLAGAVLLCAGLCAFLFFAGSGSGLTAEIRQNGKLLYSIDLAAQSEAKTYTVGAMVVTAERGRICVTSSDCNDKTCVNTGWISRAGRSVVCLPNRVEIVITGGNDDYDVVAR